MEAGEYGLTPWTGFVTRREDVAAVAELPWNHWCVWVRRNFVFTFLSFSLRTHTACCKYEFYFYIFTASIGMRQGRGSDVAETVFNL